MGKKPAHWDVFDVAVISDLTLDGTLPLSPLLPCGTLQGISLVCVKHQTYLITVSRERHQSGIKAFTELFDSGYRG